jgi:ParB/Sulfiredoxin domain
LPITEWPATEIELRDIESLEPYVRNARVHPPKQIDQIVASMREFGFTIPLLIDESGTIIAGHGRLMAAKILAKNDAAFAQVPVMVARGWTDTQRRAYTIADNRLTEASSWDLDLLRLELSELRELALDPSILGFEGFFPADGTLDQNAAWQGMPGYQHADQTGFHMLVVHFKDQDGVDKFAELVGQPVTTATKYIWFPDPEPRFVSRDKRYKAAPEQLPEQAAE